MDQTKARHEPTLDPRQRGELMRQYRVTSPEVVDSFLRHARDEDNAIEQLISLRATCPEFFRKGKHL
ncbi:hypothetical protein C5Y93_05830 [Blastopirellula marina]|uniref:Uncharacterized protein n=1 Tax=Blastopirellula marina TaxID=124 RepID=A0A2S8GRF9_9BACT|nr:hypothetical protein C5Y93_05830 [Blastopirellula marina]